MHQNAAIERVRFLPKSVCGCLPYCRNVILSRAVGSVQEALASLLNGEVDLLTFGDPRQRVAVAAQKVVCQPHTRVGKGVFFQPQWSARALKIIERASTHRTAAFVHPQ